MNETRAQNVSHNNNRNIKTLLFNPSLAATKQVEKPLLANNTTDYDSQALLPIHMAIEDGQVAMQIEPPTLNIHSSTQSSPNAMHIKSHDKYL